MKAFTIAIHYGCRVGTRILSRFVVARSAADAVAQVVAGIVAEHDAPGAPVGIIGTHYQEVPTDVLQAAALDVSSEAP